ncbi:MAG: FHA domain-containing protein [Synechococcales cyanobacterium C42_A2020_086]|jgi:pSer/pThr/pTyr-binding forkhead associated (FHA) protein|nr:FHA domain-containing protein [Synechococcales cyanobacterium C42_A2020_086]
MQIQLTWDDPITEEPQQHTAPLPIAIGRELAQLPTELAGEPVYQVVLLSANNEISRCHALIMAIDGQIILEDRSTNGTHLNGERITRARRPLTSGDTLQIGTYTITVSVLQPIAETQDLNRSSTIIFNPDTTIVSADQVAPEPVRQSTIIFDPDTDRLEPQAPPPGRAVTTRNVFPPARLFAEERVSISALHATGFPVEETEYAALGGGMGSFVWVDTLRIAGVKPERITVLSIQKKPYGRYETLLKNCQIPRYKRIRSGSDSCPDNIWGWPGYAIREAWRDTFSGRVGAALGYLWQVFAEPAFADTYTPIADNVFKSMDREADRIGWDRMVRYGSIRSIRKTEDGRYVIAYSATRPPGPPDYRFLVARYVHLCTGYPAIKLLDDLQDYRERTGDVQTVVHGYEPHDHVFEQLERKGGTLVIRGFGIVGSQIMDRVYKARMVNPRIFVVHLSRSPKLGQRFGRAKRYVENHWEFQPFNWPKGTWGGDMRAMLEAADPLRRRELLEAWGGTTTASRGPWRKIINQGLREGWYTIKFGTVDKVERSPDGKPITFVRSNEYHGIDKIEADFVIDCTGLISDPREQPLLNDLITHYNLDLNPQKRLHVENDFEIAKMRNDRARMYAAGIITLGGPYAPVDTFLGLQYAAHRAVEALATHRAPGVRYIEGLGSLWQWVKWATNQAP